LPPGMWVPATQLGSEQWFLLSYYGSRHVIRFITASKVQPAKDPSDHRLRQIVVEGTVKWRPRDPSTIVIRDLPPLGARK
jgi:hypothetical protein